LPNGVVDQASTTLEGATAHFLESSPSLRGRLYEKKSDEVSFAVYEYP
jgi:hypothetical protein